MPSAWSVTAESVPPVVESAIVAPPRDEAVVVRDPSAWTVIVEVELPSAVIVPGEAVIVEVAAEAAAGVTVRLAVVVWMPLVEFVATTVCGPTAVAVQERRCRCRRG